MFFLGELDKEEKRNTSEKIYKRPKPLQFDIYDGNISVDSDGMFVLTVMKIICCCTM